VSDSSRGMKMADCPKCGRPSGLSGVDGGLCLECSRPTAFSEHAEICPTCGQRVRVHEGDDGTSSYVGMDAERAVRAEAALAAAQEERDKALGNLRYIDADPDYICVWCNTKPHHPSCEMPEYLARAAAGGDE